ncbi:hypothetical protein FQR65_LT15316 [Abscondita terminalis]|nr:hypothetical protein FQR65_LT15316 [Abscondita terminalis]
MNNQSNQLGEDMIVCPYNRFHVMLQNRLAKHVFKCHPEETRAKQQKIFNEKMANECWDEDEPSEPFVPQLDTSMYINKKCFVYGRN